MENLLVIQANDKVWSPSERTEILKQAVGIYLQKNAKDAEEPLKIDEEEPLKKQRLEKEQDADTIAISSSSEDEIILSESDLDNDGF